MSNNTIRIPKVDSEHRSHFGKWSTNAEGARQFSACWLDFLIRKLRPGRAESSIESEGIIGIQFGHVRKHHSMTMYKNINHKSL
jgi:hypothetical protein